MGKNIKPKRVLMIGQSGLNKSYYLNETKKILNRENKKFEFDTIGDKMIKIYDKGITEKNILNLSRELLEHLGRQAWQEILNSVTQLSCNFHVLNAHTVFRWDHGLLPVIEIDLLIEYNPELIICLIDDIIDIQNILINRGIYKFNLWELFAWREEEIWLGKFMAEFLRKLLRAKDTKYYILPKKQGAQLFSQILLNPDLPKVYMSFPITGIPKQEQDDIEKFKKIVNSKFIAFDPYAIKDREITFKYYSLENEIKEDLDGIMNLLKEKSKNLSRDFWEIYLDDDTALSLIRFKNLEKLGFPAVELLGREHLVTHRAIDAQIIARDFLLIEQVDFIIVYIKEENGKPRISAGCQTELVFAYSHGKPVYVIYKGAEKKLSPWVTEFSRTFKTTKNCLEFINEEYLKKGGKK